MNFKPDDGNDLRPEMNITPLIDVVLLLLIFFMITTSFVVQPGLQVKLPEAETAEPARAKDIEVLITQEGTIYLGDLPVEPADLEAEFNRLRSGGRTGTVVVKADERVAHGRVVQVMDKARTAGLTRFAIATRPAE